MLEDFAVEQLIAKLPSVKPVDQITVLIFDRPETSLPHAYLRRRSIGNTDTVKLDHSIAGLQISYEFMAKASSGSKIGALPLSAEAAKRHHRLV